MNKLKHTDGRAIVSVDIEYKNWHTFEDGTKIRLERQYDNFNRRYTEPVNAIVVSGENILQGAEILVHPNAIIETNRINNYRQLSGADTSSPVKYYSIPENQCFIWKDEHDVWQPLPPFETALRVFEPYTGILQGIEPKQIPDTLFVTSGELKGFVVKTLKACDYEIVFQDTNGRESSIIRFRPNGDEKNSREPEAIAIMNELTKKVISGEILIGLTPNDAKQY